MKFAFFRLFSLALFGAIATSSAYSAESAGLKLLLIGDSHTVGEFGQELHRKLESLPGAKVASHGSWGSSPSWWLNGKATNYRLRSWNWDGSRLWVRGTAATPILSDLVAEVQPDYVIVALGSNLLGVEDTSWAASSIRELMLEARRVSRRGCVWVGPPSMRQNGSGKRLDANDYAVVENAIARAASEAGCAVVDSLSKTKFPKFGGDGIHYDSIPVVGMTRARAWAGAIFESLRSVLN